MGSQSFLRLLNANVAASAKLARVPGDVSPPAVTLHPLLWLVPSSLDPPPEPPAPLVPAPLEPVVALTVVALPVLLAPPLALDDVLLDVAAPPLLDDEDALLVPPLQGAPQLPFTQSTRAV